MAKPQPTPWVPIDRAPDLAREALQNAAKTLAAGSPRDALRACGWAWSQQRYLREAYELARSEERRVGKECV